jgi:hypothetical protein
MYQLGDHKNQHGSYPFIYNKQIHLFGGYGLFTLKNIITYFDTKTKEWDVEDCYDPYHDLPLPRSLPLAQVNQNNVFIGAGHIKNLESGGARQLNDFWKFDFNTKKWSKLGEMIKPINNYVYHISNIINNVPLVFDGKHFYGFDIAQNKLIEYPERLKARLYGSLTIYNPYTDCFLYEEERKGLMEDIKIVSAKVFLGEQRVVSQLYEPVNSKIYYVIISTIGVLGIIGIASLFYRYKYKKLPIRKQIKLKSDIIFVNLDEDELSILTTILDNYPNKTTYYDLMGKLDQKFSYDTQKKKLKMTLDEIDFKIQEILDTDESIFIYSKNDSDKRMKEVQIK